MHAALLVIAVLAPAACALEAAARLRVCTNTACRKAGSQDVLLMLRTLAAVSEESPTSGIGPAAANQEAFGASHVEGCGCLGGCGNGPNCYSVGSDQVFYDVFKPSTGVRLLEDELQLTVPPAAAKAALLKRYADRALRSNQPAEALGLLTEALNTAGALRVGGALLLARLLADRADVHDQLRSPEAAAADRAQAEAMRALRVPEAVSQFESVVPRNT